jgi:hypothetical protein
VTNLLFVADVIGSPGRDVLRALLPELKPPARCAPRDLQLRELGRRLRGHA